MSRLFSTGQVAKLLGVTEWTVDHWRLTGVLPRPHRLGQTYYWSRASLDAYLDERLATQEEDEPDLETLLQRVQECLDDCDALLEDCHGHR